MTNEKWPRQRNTRSPLPPCGVRPSGLLPGFRRAQRLTSVFLSALLATSLIAQTNSLPDFSSLSLQELSLIKVTSVSKTDQMLSQVAAAVYVISQDEIHRSGMTNVADLLRLVPGLSVARLNGSEWAVTSHNFQPFRQ